MPVFVGVDSGGSSTRAIAADGDRIIGTAEGPGANLRRLGVENAANEIAATVTRALGRARPHAIFVGTAGAGSPQVAEALRTALGRFFADTAIGVCDDARIALRAGVESGDGVVIVAGTGSIAYAEVNGRVDRCGGYGPLVSDEGSAFAIGSAAVRLLLRSYDGRAPREAWFLHLEVNLKARDAQGVVDYLYASPVSELAVLAPIRAVAQLAALAPIVLAAAQDGERGATKIVQAAALDLFDLIKCVVRAAGLSARSVPLVFAGGLLAGNSLLSYLLETRVSNEFPHLEPRKGVAEPRLGALALARALLV
jgi:glucosamine kinase